MAERTRRGRFPRFALALVAACTSVGVSSCATAPTQLTTTTVVSGLHRPWDIAFLPDGTMVFTERTGPVSAMVGGAKRVLVTPADVEAVFEGGMMGLAVDPDFSSNRYVFTCFLANRSGTRDVRLVRWKVDASVTSLTDRTDILTGMPVNAAGQAGRHAGCRPRFGPDGYLWVTTGDAAVNSNPQDPNSLGGKILRIDRNGAPAPDNAGPPFRGEVYSYGHRNPQGIAFRPADGQPFVVEHGTGCDDEINLPVRRGNYGWDPKPAGGGSAYDESRPMTDTLKFPDAISAVWSSGCPTVAPSGAGFLTGSQWSAWDNSLAVAVLKGTELHIFRFNDDGTKYLDWITMEDKGRLRVAVQGPDGDLYVAQDADPGAILKLHPGA